MIFSVIIPVHNPTLLLPHSEISARHRDAEVLIIDDGSTEWKVSTPSTYRSDRNRGPGAARNIGIERASGDWIVFLDSDDTLATGALERLAAFIDAHPDYDAIGYGWDWLHNQGSNQRKDAASLELPNHELLAEYLKLRMDGSVIFTAVKRSLIMEHGIQFRDGLHEDIDFIFNVYRLAHKIAYMPAILYHKRKRAGAITSTITQAHIDGFFSGWQEIGRHAAAMGMVDAYEIGTIGVIATRVREVMYKAVSPALLDKLRESIPVAWKLMAKHTQLDTLYAKVAKQLLENADIDYSIFEKSWSCTDLQSSLFLAPNEIRTCCKRFFVGGEMRGDVKLVCADAATPENILAAKQRLIDGLNKGDITPCTGCTFAEFKQWGDISPLKIQHLSMEHHSVCNMKCEYCDDKYYGGAQPSYAVEALLRELETSEALSTVQSVVWGGGEPVVGKQFPRMVEHLMAATTADQRFLSNALVFSSAIATSIRSGRGTITTSIDAGTSETFAKVRGTDLGLRRVIDNVRAYALINAQAVTIKYILTEHNTDHTELLSFKELILRNELTNCNFQISCDFKHRNAERQAIAAFQLFTMLREAGCAVVFFDDLLMQRLVTDDTGLLAASWMHNYYADARAWPDDYPDGVVVFGTGGMTDWTLAHTDFFKHVSVVERNKLVAGIPVVITGVQGYAANYRKALRAGVPEWLIVRGVII